MKIYTILAMIAAVAFSSLSAYTDETLQARLVRVELDYVSGIAMGLTPNHPRIKSLKTELDALNQHPEIRNEEYIRILKEKRIHAQVDLAKLQAEGFESEHPLIKSAKAREKAIESLLKQKS